MLQRSTRPRWLFMTCMLGMLTATIWFVRASAQVPEDAVALQSRSLTESSGLAASWRTADVIWTHNDSGDGPRLFAFRLDGECLAEVMLDGIRAIDWEDMCSFQIDGKSYLAVGDVGDNSRRRKSVMIYILEEPELGQAGQGRGTGPQKLTIDRQDFIRIEVRYARGAVDCESLAYDPLRKELLLCSKESLRSRLHRIPFQLDQREQAQVADGKQALTIPLATAADISPDGRYLIITTYGPGFVISRDQANEGWDTDGEKVQVIELPIRRQGESVCFSADGQRLYLTSEGRPAPFWNVPFPLEDR